MMLWEGEGGVCVQEFTTHLGAGLGSLGVGSGTQQNRILKQQNNYKVFGGLQTTEATTQKVLKFTNIAPSSTF